MGRRARQGGVANAALRAGQRAARAALKAEEESRTVIEREAHVLAQAVYVEASSGKYREGETFWAAAVVAAGFVSPPIVAALEIESEENAVGAASLLAEVFVAAAQQLTPERIAEHRRERGI